MKRLINKNLSPTNKPWGEQTDAIKTSVIPDYKVNINLYEGLDEKEVALAKKLGFKNALSYINAVNKHQAEISQTTPSLARSLINLQKARETARKFGRDEDKAARIQAVQDGHNELVMKQLSKEYSDEEKQKRNLGAGLLLTGLVGASNPLGLITGVTASTAVDEAVKHNSDYKNWTDMITNQNEFTLGVGALTEGIPLVGNIWGISNPGWYTSKGLNAVNKKVLPVIKFYKNMPNFAKKAYFKDMKNTLFPRMDSLDKPFLLDFSDVKNSKWYSALKRTYGLEFADNAVKMMDSPEFKLYFIGDDPIKAMSEINKFHLGMDIYSKLAGDPNYGLGVVQGSAALSANGTVHRATAAPHDLDFKANIKDASRQPIDVSDKQQVEQALRTLFLNEDRAVTDAPIFNLFKKQFGSRPYINIPKGVPRWLIPKSRNNAFYLTRMFGISEPYGVHKLVLTDVNGYPLDFFMTDLPVKMSSNKYGLGTAEEPLYWKNKWIERNPRPKDVHDVNEYIPFSDANPIIDIANGDHNYSPFMFGRRLVTKEGYPIIKNIETYPNSGIKVPATMNWKGEWKVLGNPIIDDALLMEAHKQGGKLN